MKKNISAVLGLSWGDEGKGKIVDALAHEFDMVMRFNGGGNAGHTIVLGETTFKLHHIPAGIFSPNVTNIIGRKCVVDFFDIIEEITQLKNNGVEISPHNLMLSYDSQVVLPYHKQMDALREKMRGNGKVGTTGRGIGPAYADLISRVGITLGDIANNSFKEKLANEVRVFNAIAREFQEVEISLSELEAHISSLRHSITPFITDSYSFLRKNIAAGKKLLLEGAQGALLDAYFGTRPFVSSSLACIHGALLDLGLAFQDIAETIGVTKLYNTRVGNGAFPTEFHDEQLRSVIQGRGKEFGATTGRARRCGWLDLPTLKVVSSVNNVSAFAITKVDVLDTLDEIQICDSFVSLSDDEDIPYYPGSDEYFAGVLPRYKKFAGWKSATAGAVKKEQLPSDLVSILHFIEKETTVPIKFISTGAKREELIRVEP
ncbi:MAG: adenylosuccinate synthase [Ignavibacteriales bacterium]|nr:adenylosuccinate synthase [Ignavibacteriales bacterium]